MSAYNVFDRLSNYKGTFGHAKKEDIYDIGADRLDQMIFEFDYRGVDALKDGASSYILHKNMESRRARDMALDLKNPREEMKKNPSDIQQIDMIPNQIMPQIDISHPADYEASNAVKLVQMAQYHAYQQENMFTDPQAINQDLERNDVDPETRSQRDVSLTEGSAGGYQTNFLNTDQDGSYVNVVNKDQAF